MIEKHNPMAISTTSRFFSYSYCQSEWTKALSALIFSSVSDRISQPAEQPSSYNSWSLLKVLYHSKIVDWLNASYPNATANKLQGA